MAEETFEWFRAGRKDRDFRKSAELFFRNRVSEFMKLTLVLGICVLSATLGCALAVAQEYSAQPGPPPTREYHGDHDDTRGTAESGAGPRAQITGREDPRPGKDDDDEVEVGGERIVVTREMLDQVRNPSSFPRSVELTPPS